MALIASYRYNNTPISTYIEQYIRENTSKGKVEIEVRYGNFAEKVTDTNKTIKVFQSSVSRETYNRVLSYYSSTPLKRENKVSNDIFYSKIEGQGKNKVIRNIRVSIDENNNTTITEKINTEHIDLVQYGIRIALAVESTPKDFSAKQPADDKKWEQSFIREKNRVTFSSDIDKLDMTIIRNSEEKYEVELEYIIQDKNRIDDINKYLKDAENLLLIYQNTLSLYTSKEKEDIIRYFNEVQGSIKEFREEEFKQKEVHLDEGTITQARNLTLPDIVWGGLLGGKISYIVSNKADGTRKFLVIQNGLLWTVSSPNFVSLLSRDKRYKEFEGYIFESEQIPQNKRNFNFGAPKVEIWLLLYDTLVVNNNEIQQHNYFQRYSHLVDFVNWFSSSTNNNIKIEIKPFLAVDSDYDSTVDLVTNSSGYDLEVLRRISDPDNDINLEIKKNPKLEEVLEKIPTHYYDRNDIIWSNYKDKTLHNPITTQKRVARFFTRIREMIEQQSFTPYYTDGLIFTPINCDYLPITSHKVKIGRDAYNYRLSTSYALNSRRLTTMPDICKWKPVITIDFMIKRKNGLIFLYSNKKVINDEDSTRSQRKNVEETKKKWKTVEVLFSGTVKNPYQQTGLSETAETKNVPDKSIAEYSYDLNLKQMMLVRIRDDKSKPNQLQFAEANWDLIYDAVTSDVITGNSLEPAFKYHNRIKRDLFDVQTRENPNQLVLLDIGSGRGGDITKWFGFRKIYAVEPNSLNVSELRDRLKKFDMEEKVTVIETGGEDYTTINNEMSEKADVISLMLSLSLFWSSSRVLDKLVRTINENLKPNGTIIFLTVSGTEVNELFRKQIDVSSDIDVAQTRSPFMDDKFITNFRELLTCQITYFPDYVDGELFVKYYENKLLVETGEKVHYPMVNFNIPGTIINYSEWLVNIQDLLLRLPDYRLVKYDKANSEHFLSEKAQVYSSLYNYGVITRSKSKSAVRDIEKLFSELSLKPDHLTEAELEEGGKLIDEKGVIKREEKSQTTKKEDSIAKQTAAPKGSLREIYDFPAESVAVSLGNLRSAIGSAEDKIVQKEKKEKEEKRDIENKEKLKPVPERVKTKEKKDGKIHVPGINVRAAKNRNEVAINDDKIEELPKDNIFEIIAGKKLVRLATIGDGSCFFHAFLKSFDPEYQNNKSYRDRKEMASILRREIAETLQQDSEIDVDDATIEKRRKLRYLDRPKYRDDNNKRIIFSPEHPKLLKYEAYANNLFANYVQATHNLAKKEKLEIEFTLRGLQDLFDSDEFVGNEVYGYVTYILDSPLIVLDGYYEKKDDLSIKLRYITDTLEYSRKNTAVIFGNGMHYEVLNIVDLDADVSRLELENITLTYPQDNEFIREILRISKQK